ncbi:hypothetical protein [Clostridium sp. BNL1100]|uniref:hypothetical protein n=1 Tax=Clostridium sp. BNL1100 TaxID=755731 RepID=UPI00024A7C2E|nr:hypothetical protein [Clostridium sp. BNL1100]AEY67995.1 hypothetical protein Clo1100_3882 [Clostridium sp. BNL1100]
MDKKISHTLDLLDIKETDKLLEKELKFKLDSNSIKRIKKSTYSKAGIMRRKTFVTRGLSAIAAAIIIIVVSIFSIGFDNVVSAMGRLFGFIPGYGIMEDNQSIQYIIDGRNISSENSQAILTINSVIATKNNLTLNCLIKLKSFHEEKNLSNIENNIQHDKNNLVMAVNGKEYRPSGCSIGSGGKVEYISAAYQIEQDNLSTRDVYRFNYNKYNLSVEFRLKVPEGYDSLEEIGPTDTKNNISITAVSSRQDNKLLVELYPVNKSGLTITSFTKEYDFGYEKKELTLETDKTSHSYTIPEGFMGVNNKFYFNVLPQEKNLTLKIPYLIVKSQEKMKKVTLKIPEEGKRVTINKKVKFKNSTMVISDVERIKNGNPNGALRIYFKFENEDKNMVMFNAQFRRVNILGMEQGGGYSTNLKEGIPQSIDYSLDEPNGDVLRLGIKDPEYFLLGEYSLKLNNIL